MRRAALALALAAVAAAGCGKGDQAKDARKTIRQATEKARDGGSEAVDQADKALEQLKESDLPADARKQLEDAKRLIDEQK